MLHSKTKWKINDHIEEHMHWNDIKASVPPIIKDLLIQRGITNEQEALQFLSPNIDQLHHPEGFDAIEKAAARVHQAIENKEKILVFGDYDADGVSSTTVLLHALEELEASCDFYIPNRFTEGYGPNEEAFRVAAQNGYSLIITVDTGIASVHEAELANELGIDLIITDHHEPQETLPNAFAIIHPKCSPNYPFKELAGVGVAFKFAQYILGYFPEHLLDLVAIGTIADLVPLVGENRIFAYYGLKKLANTKRAGLMALKQQCKLTNEVTEEDVGFLIGPRLNAVGRLQDADLAVELLLADNEEVALELAERIDQLNQKRQQIVSEIVTEVEEMVDLQTTTGIIVIANKGWNEGVLGIVASRLVRKYDRPAIVLAINEETGTAKGSARSIPAFDLFQNCMKVKDLFVRFGGHAQAAGMTLELDKVSELRTALNHLVMDQLTEEDFKQELEISKQLAVTDMSESLIQEIGKLAPFGMGNPKPRFLIQQVPVDARQLGNNKKHLKLQFKQADTVVEGIGFGLGELYSFITPKTEVSVAGELRINEWNGFKKLQIVMEDIQINDWQLFDHRGKKNVDLQSFKGFESSAVLANDIDNVRKDLGSNIPVISYDSDLDALQKVNTLFIVDLPPALPMLGDYLTQLSPVNIHVCFQLEESMYMARFPSREDFKWYYAQIWKQKTIDLKQDIRKIMAAKKWTKNDIIFMSKVFSELEFVKIDNGVVTFMPTSNKKDLHESWTYHQRLTRAKVEETLYYSTYEQLKDWVGQFIDLEGSKEEKANGLQAIH
ncbi:single-stranded-DNA-specific exonuclease RecJ [Virgibacillus sp. LDC-1]|uniref:single-stranded-DNA-specific exonuclease RecJ n=1 Tax=Virgibacillus sp. LDC-1 TaxID=3039856 RepID=UPI0024DE49CC|nr:single-stranded-DNA-specific exonuclease RecJ [Virgibacillus sp. LDC-1]